MFSCKFLAYFQNSFLKEHLWRAASELMMMCNFQCNPSYFLYWKLNYQHQKIIYRIHKQKIKVTKHLNCCFRSSSVDDKKISCSVLIFNKKVLCHIIGSTKGNRIQKKKWEDHCDNIYFIINQNKKRYALKQSRSFAPP